MDRGGARGKESSGLGLHPQVGSEPSSWAVAELRGHLARFASHTRAVTTDWLHSCSARRARLEPTGEQLVTLAKLAGLKVSLPLLESLPPSDHADLLIITLLDGFLPQPLNSLLPFSRALPSLHLPGPFLTLRTPALSCSMRCRDPIVSRMQARPACLCSQFPSSPMLAPFQDQVRSQENAKQHVAAATTGQEIRKPLGSSTSARAGGKSEGRPLPPPPRQRKEPRSLLEGLHFTLTALDGHKELMGRAAAVISAGGGCTILDTMTEGLPDKLFAVCPLGFPPEAQQRAKTSSAFRHGASPVSPPAPLSPPFRCLFCSFLSPSSFSCQTPCRPTQSIYAGCSSVSPASDCSLHPPLAGTLTFPQLPLPMMSTSFLPLS